MLHASKTWSVKEEDMIRIEKSDSSMVNLMWNDRSEDIISAEKLGNRIKLNGMRECLQKRKIQWFTRKS